MSTGFRPMLSSAFRVLCGVLLIAGFSIGCRTSDVRIQTIRVPQMINLDCAQLIVKSLERSEGVIKIDYSLQDKTVAVTYDSLKLALKNLEVTIATAGFDANDTPADQRARAALPAACLPAAPTR